MPKRDELKIVLRIDPRPLVDECREASDRIQARVATTARERVAAVERMHRRHLAGAADVFDASRARRRRLDPRRLLDARHARACRRWIRFSEIAEAKAAR